MNHQRTVSSRFQEVIEVVESLPPDDQALLIEIVQERLVQWRRAELVKDVVESRSAYKSGDIQRGTVADLLRDLG